jgi:hypothetical protein
MRHVIRLLLVACTLVACSTQRPIPSPRIEHPGLSRSEVFSHLSTRPGGVTFVSRNGRMYGMDSDAKITLKANNQAEVTEYGFAPQDYMGTYFVDASGAIHVSLRRYRAKWPTTYLRKDKRGAILFPTDQDPSFRMGGRAGAFETSEMAPYWPFRQTK